MRAWFNASGPRSHAVRSAESSPLGVSPNESRKPVVYNIRSKKSDTRKP
jgi:hypothetical protein